MSPTIYFLIHENFDLRPQAISGADLEFRIIAMWLINQNLGAPPVEQGIFRKNLFYPPPA